MDTMTPSVPELVGEAIAWAHLHGLVVGQGDGTQDVSIVHAPLSLLPTPFPASEFKLVQQTMPLFADLVHAISRDEEYLLSTLAEAAKYDDFTANLVRVYQASRQANSKYACNIHLGLHRSDYMLDEPSGSLLQVELNTIAASFGSLSTRVSSLHRYLLSRHPSAAPIGLEQLPEQNALQGFASALAGAHRAVREAHGGAARHVVVMVVQPGERNAYDQQWLQLQLWEEHAVHVVRKTLTEIADEGVVGDDGTLTIGGVPVSVFYLRAGYTPADYPSEKEWLARELMESCSAVSCPTVAYQLVGAKKIQQDLASPGQLERYVSDEEQVKQLRSCFAGLWGLDDPAAEETKRIIAAAVAKPDDYVLKPQREGGGHNKYGQELVDTLTAGEGLASYILMQRIRPPVNKSVLVRKGNHSEEETLSELGVYGTYLRIDDKVTVNECVGHLLRTKTKSSDEGGVAAGFAVLDSPYLV